MTKSKNLILMLLLLPTSVLAQSYAPSLQVEPVAGSPGMVRFVVCDARMRDGNRVTFSFEGGGTLPGRFEATDTLAENQICVTHRLNILENTDVKAGKNLIVSARTNAGDIVIRTIAAAQLRGETAPAQSRQSSSFQFSTSRIENGTKLRVRLCGGNLRAGELIGFRIGENGLVMNPRATVREIDGQLCAQREMTISTLPRPQSEIEILLIASRSETEIFRHNIRSALTSDQRPSSAAGATTTAPQTPIERPKQQGNASEIRTNAQDAGQETVNWIVARFAQIEKIRQSYREGYAAEKRFYDQQNINGTYLREHARGSQAADREYATIRPNAERYGESLASQEALSLATQMIRERVLQAKAANSAPNFSTPRLTHQDQMRRFVPSTVGQAPSKLEARSAQLRRETLDELSRLFPNIPGQNTSANFFAENFQGNSTGLDVVQLLEPANRGEIAFEAWLRGKIPTQNSMTYSQYYSVIGNSEIFEQPRNNQRAFRDIFVQTYNSSIQQSWRRVVDDQDEIASESFNIGVEAFIKDLSDFARESGYFERRNILARNAQERAFINSFERHFKANFERLAAENRSSALVEIGNLFLTSSSGRIDQMTIGDVLSLTIQGATNTGGRGDTVLITLAGGTGLRVLQNTSSFTIGADEVVNQVMNFEGLAAITSVSTENPDTVMEVIVTLQGQERRIAQQKITIKSTLEALMNKVAEQRDPSETERLVSLVHGYLKKEWDDNAGAFGTIYDNNDVNQVIQRFAEAYKRMNSAGKAQWNEHASLIRSALNGGSKPWWFDAVADDFREANKILDGVEFPKN